jgi:glycerol uptake facilitator-like aquaporin
MSTLARRLTAEALGSAFLLAAVVGSGIMAERLSQGNDAVALLANAIATGGALVALIVTFGPVSGAHFNPAVSIALAASGHARWKEVLPYIAVQCVGALAGVAAAHGMFDLPLWQASVKPRAGLNQIGSEFIATLGLLAVVLSCAAHASKAAPYAVAAYITGAYWFTSSTSFANPAVTLARAFTDTFSGIGINHVPGFMAGQAVALIVAIPLMRWLTGAAGRMP